MSIGHDDTKKTSSKLQAGSTIEDRKEDVKIDETTDSIKKKNITSSSDKLLYEFYTQDGQKVDLSVCENSTMYISSPLPILKSTDENDEESIQLTNQIEQLAKLSQKE